MIWKEKYRIGVPVIDAQHEELFRRVDAFVETLRAPGDWEQKLPRVQQTLDFMKEYVVTHFRYEEGFQNKVGYPLCNEHKKIHDDMVAYVETVANRFETEGQPQPLMQQFAGKLLAWLINHVAATDQKMAEYVNRKGGKSE